MSEHQLVITLYRLAHGYSFSIVGDLFGVSESLADKTFNHVVLLLVARLYDVFVKLPLTGEEWELELRGFTENYEFPCVGAWDGFHVYVSSKLKQSYSFEKRYTMTNLALIGNNTGILYAAIGAPGSTPDSRMLKSTQLYQDIIRGNVIPNIQLHLEGSGETPLCTIGDSAFPRHPWLLKVYLEETKIPQQRHFNKKFSSARVVTKNAHVMLKKRWSILYKKTECQMFNLKYIIMAYIMLHNLCIDHNDPREPRWRLEVLQLGLAKRRRSWSENKEMSDLNRMKCATGCGI